MAKLAPLLGYLDKSNGERYCVPCWFDTVPKILERIRYVELDLIEPMYGNDIGPYDGPFYCDYCGDPLSVRAQQRKKRKKRKKREKGH